MISCRPIATRPIAVGPAPSTGGASYTLTVNVGTLSLTAQSVTLRVTRQLSVTSAALALTGQSISLKPSYAILVSSGTLTLSGQSIQVYANGLNEVFGVSGESTQDRFTPTRVSRDYGVIARTQ